MLTIPVKALNPWSPRFNTLLKPSPFLPPNPPPSPLSDRVPLLVLRKGTSLVQAPLRARGAAALPYSITLDRAPVLAQICSTEELRGEAAGGTGGRRGGWGRFRHYLVTTGAVNGLPESERLGRMYEESAW